MKTLGLEQIRTRGMNLPPQRSMVSPEQPSRGAKVRVLPVRRKPPLPWWERVLRRLRYGQRAPSGST